MDYEIKERLRLVGRLITDLSLGSIQDLGRKTEALSILRSVIQADEPRPEPAYSLDVVEAWERLHIQLSGGTDTNISALDIMNDLYEVGMKVGGWKAENAAKGRPERDCVETVLSARNRAAAVERATGQRHVDDIEFFRQGGI